MKKILTIATIMLMTLSILTACGNKEELATEPIEGTVTEEVTSDVTTLSGVYKLTKIHDETGDVEVPENESATFTFKEDGTLTFDTKDIVGDIEEATIDSLQDVTYTGTYTVSGSTVSVTYTAKSGEQHQDYIMDSDSLSYTDTENGVTMTYTKAN